MYEPENFVKKTLIFSINYIYYYYVVSKTLNIYSWNLEEAKKKLL